MSERRRIIEGTWICGECGTEDIPGRDQKCSSCGSPREDTEADFDFGDRTASGASKAKSANDDLIARAKAGEDWNCEYCEAANTATDERCSVCGAHRTEKDKADTPPPPSPGEDVESRTSGGGGGVLASIFGCGSFAVVGAVFLVGTAVCIWAFFMTSETAGKVTARHWERTVTVESFMPVTKEGWRSELPKGQTKMPVEGKGESQGAANIRGCADKEKSPRSCETKTVDKPCGTEEKCEVKDLGNGFAEEVCKDVPKYCEEKVEECTDAVFEAWCTYDTHEWQKKDSKTLSGADDPKWPALKATGKHDRAVKTDSYSVTVSYEGQRHEQSVRNAAEFATWIVGNEVVVTTNNLGTVTNVRPKK